MKEEYNIKDYLNPELSKEIIEELVKENAELKAKLQKFQDMAKKGLDEFKDEGGCWGCGLQLQLNQDIEDIKQLKAEKEKYYQQTLDDEIQINELLQTLQEIKKIIIQEKVTNNKKLRAILDLITKAEVGE